MKYNKNKKYSKNKDLHITSIYDDHYDIQMDHVDMDVLRGKIFTEVFKTEIGDQDTIVFITTERELFHMTHEQECFEHVSINDICGDLEDLIGTPILISEEVSKVRGVLPEKAGEETFTWTFYKMDTVKGGVTIRWYGESNGYYSETADLYKLTLTEKEECQLH